MIVVVLCPYLDLVVAFEVEQGAASCDRDQHDNNRSD
jgi:hypothetical protein